MSVRKKRVPCQGITNFRNTLTNFDQEDRKKMNQNSLTTKNLQNRKLADHTNKQNEGLDKKQVRNNICNTKLEQIDNNSLKQIRKAYNNSSNVWRLAKSWKLSNQGYITQQELKERLQRIMKINLNNEQYRQIIKHYAGDQGRIDTQNFLKIIHGQPNSFAYKPRLFNISEFHQRRKEKINNLVDRLDIYQHAFQKKDKNINLKHTQIQSGQLKRAHVSQNVSNRVKSQTLQNNQFNKQQFYRLTQTSFSKFKQNKKRNQFYPELMKNKDQNKTRFGATFNIAKNDWFSPQSHLKNLGNLTSDVSSKNLSVTQKQDKKRKLQARIAKIKQIQNIQKQSIQKKQAKHLERQNARIVRKRLDKEAYQYTSFIKNEWK